jgi:hypothetical protein
VFHLEWISLHEMSDLIIAFNVTMSFRMMATVATLKGFPLGKLLQIMGRRLIQKFRLDLNVFVNRGCRRPMAQSCRSHAACVNFSSTRETLLREAAPQVGAIAAPRRAWASSQERCTSNELYRVRKTVLPFAPMIWRRVHIGILSASRRNARPD